MIRVLEVINTLYSGGAEVLLSDLLLEFQRLDVCAGILCLSPERFPLEEKLNLEGISVVHASSRSPYSPLHILAVKRQILAGKYDVIHSHLFPAQLWTCLGAQLANLNIPLVTTEHSTWNRRRREMFRPLDRWMYSKYAAIACIGISARDALRDWLDQEGPPITIIPNGIDVERFARESKARKKGKASTGATILICVANLADGKGHEVLLHAVSLLPATELLLVGEGPKRSDLQRLTQELGIAERVRFLGRRNDVPELLATADIYVQPSYWEGFGIATLEAMAAGLPVVASDVPGLRDVVGDAGLLAPAGSAVDLANCIAQLLSDPDLQSRVALLAQQRSKQFSIETTASAYLQLYKSVLGYHDATKAETENVYHGEGGK